MTSRYRCLEVRDLRADLAIREFRPRLPGGEGFGLELELFPVRWGAKSIRPEAPDLEPGRESDSGLFEVLAEFADARGWRLVPPAELDFASERSTDPSARGAEGIPELRILQGRRLALRSALHATPAGAGREIEDAFDLLGAAFERHGSSLIGCGVHPFLRPGELALRSPNATTWCLEAFCTASGAADLLAARACAAARVRIGLGSPVKAGLRWRAAQLLAPIATATFASSPVGGGAHGGCKSLRAQARSAFDPSRTGFPPAFASQPDGEPLEQYLDFALAAGTLLIRYPDRWVPQLRPRSFARWMEHGAGGTWPELGDWRFHLETLWPEVRPAGGFELDSADAQSRAFACVPLAWWAALLCDDAALAEVLELLAPTAEGLRARWEVAAQEGLVDEALARDARAIYASAAGALVRRPRGWLEPHMLAAFLAFGERFTMRRRSPADDVLDQFLARGGIDRDAWNGLERAWNASVGLGDQ